MSEARPPPAMAKPAAQLERRARRLDRLGARVSKAYARAERRIDDELAQATQRAEEADAQATQRINERKRLCDERAGGSVERPESDQFADPFVAIERSSEARPRLGAIERVRAWFTAWQRRRRYRGMLRRLDRGLARGEVRIEDQRSAALLAVLTERIARLSTTTAPPTELEQMIAIAQHLSDEYKAYVGRLAAARDAAGAAPALRDKATAELARCEASERRIDDAIAQLRALLRRSAPRPR